ncbi:MAG: LacI family DNA-binding transcriptional regulator [Bauldia sp.]|nr:LacI family DNA-binding transcriptional regulator [Bauldia sp.]
MGDESTPASMKALARNGRRSGPPAAATILDVARRAGVSTATVSRALAAPDKVAEETRARVIAAIAATGYTPNASARNLRARSTQIVLALLPGISNTFFAPILNAIEDTLSAAGYGMIIGDTRHSLQKEAHYTRFILAGQVDGVILFTGQIPRDGDVASASGRVPIALVCNEIVGERRYSVFDVDNRAAAARATTHLIAAGHRHLGHVAGDARNIEAVERMKGFRLALKRAGIPPDEAAIWEGGFRYEDGVAAATRFLALRERPTAIFASADHAAIGFIRTVRDAGIRIPEDVSIVGFDDIDYASVIDPPLTTMRQPRASLGRLAAEDLLQRMGRDAVDVPPIRERLRCDLIERETVGPVATARSVRRPAKLQREGSGAARGGVT